MYPTCPALSLVLTTPAVRRVKLFGKHRKAAKADLSPCGSGRSLGLCMFTWDRPVLDLYIA